MLTVRATRSEDDLHAWRPGALATTCGISALETTTTDDPWPPGLELDGIVCPICMAAKDPWWRRR